MSEQYPEVETGVDDPRRSKPWVLGVIKVMSRVNTWAYRVSGGRVGGNWRVGSALKAPVPVCLVTTTGRKSGEPRTVPLLHLPDGDRVLLVASQGGLPKHPQWYRNILVNPDVTVQVGRRTREMTAREATPSERAELWPRLVERYADFASYQANTSRVIPVVICEPRD
ncbi:nitroreductase family deazaflavin-dependent oxidoreductase [Dietzia sp. PP-33]|uniref:nitroreductase family deazaflavin-dependent oxidoreductase n=1 Tax=Dietzia sp. PP-33 TaxID=2957500 RepID=UPI0039AEBE83